MAASCEVRIWGVCMYDLVIREADIIDGKGGKRFKSSVGVVGGRITALSEEPLHGRVEEDGRGLVLAPGFIDVHSHDDFALLQCPTLEWKALQGVTTEIVGNCGIGAAPWPGAEAWYEKLNPGQAFPDYQDYSGYFRQIEEHGPSLNIGVLAGHGALREGGAPNTSRVLGARELTSVEAALDEALDAGVLGMSAGLIYEPGIHSDLNELVTLSTRLRGVSPLFTVHLRSEADDLLQAVDEAIAIAERAGVGLQLSHHKAHGRNNWGKVHDSLKKVDAARARGMDVWLDQYPYTAGSTILQAIVDRGGLDSGPALGKLLPEDIVIASSPGDTSLEGESLGALALRFNCSPQKAADEVLRIDPGAWVVVHAMAETDVCTVMRHPATLFGSDGLPTQGGRPHPRLWGTFPRILGRYCREEKVLELEEAIAKMTYRAAQRFGLRDRGLVAEGAWADLVLFDPEKIAEGATYEEPTQAPRGIVSVWVNGDRIVHQGAHTGARPGRALRREA